MSVDVATGLASQIGDRSDDAAQAMTWRSILANQSSTCNSGNRWSEVGADMGILFEELAYEGGLVRREVVEGDVNLFAGRAQGDNLLQEINELSAGE
jgi:hypothetical protein